MPFLGRPVLQMFQTINLQNQLFNKGALLHIRKLSRQNRVAQIRFLLLHRQLKDLGKLRPIKGAT
jgi:hypothetical protein